LRLIADVDLEQALRTLAKLGLRQPGRTLWLTHATPSGERRAHHPENCILNRRWHPSVNAVANHVVKAAGLIVNLGKALAEDFDIRKAKLADPRAPGAHLRASNINFDS
jgi:hypothetical protein